MDLLGIIISELKARQKHIESSFTQGVTSYEDYKERLGEFRGITTALGIIDRILTDVSEEA